MVKIIFKQVSVTHKLYMHFSQGKTLTRKEADALMITDLFHQSLGDLKNKYKKAGIDSPIWFVKDREGEKEKRYFLKGHGCHLESSDKAEQLT